MRKIRLPHVSRLQPYYKKKTGMCMLLKVLSSCLQPEMYRVINHTQILFKKHSHIKSSCYCVAFVPIQNQQSPRSYQRPPKLKAKLSPTALVEKAGCCRCHCRGSQSINVAYVICTPHTSQLLLLPTASVIYLQQQYKHPPYTKQHMQTRQ